MSSDKLTYNLVLRSSPDQKFGVADVAALAEQIRRHGDPQANIICHTDMDAGEGWPKGVDWMSLTHRWRGWWSKLEAFRVTTPSIYLDLDTAVVGSLKPLEDAVRAYAEGSFWMLHPFRARETWASGVMAWRGDFSWIMKEFQPGSDDTIYQWDQRYIAAKLTGLGVRLRGVQDFLPGVYSWKRHCQNGVPADARLICFHGKRHSYPSPAAVASGVDTGQAQRAAAAIVGDSRPDSPAPIPPAIPAAPAPSPVSSQPSADGAIQKGCPVSSNKVKVVCEVVDSPIPSGVWFAIPTANIPQALSCFAKWRAMGYRCAALVDKKTGKDWKKLQSVCEVIIQADRYVNWGWAVNLMGRYLAPRCPIMVTGGDDMDPDPSKDALTLEHEFTQRFPDLFGVMQPTGDRWQEDEKGRAASERICGSPWVGRDFYLRMNGGMGCLREEYRHCFADEELKNVSEKLGVLWQRPDVTQMHHHWTRYKAARPDYLVEAQEQWAHDRDLFRERKEAGFPGHEPLKAIPEAKPPRKARGKRNRTRQTAQGTVAAPKAGASTGLAFPSLSKAEKQAISGGEEYMNLVGLMLVKNEDWVLNLSAHAALEWVDRLIIQDDGSTDGTQDIVAALMTEYGERRVRSFRSAPDEVWHEMEMRQRLLEYAKTERATHIALIDADEVLTGNLLPDIRDMAARTQPGQVLDLPMIAPWRSLDEMRTDNCTWTRSWISTVVGWKEKLAWKRRDDGYEFHARTPFGADAKNAERPAVQGGVMHLQFSNWPRITAKHAWYKVSERARWPDLPSSAAEALNAKYGMALDETGLKTEPVPASFWAGYEQWKPGVKLGDPGWYPERIRKWLRECGAERFAGLDLFGVA